MMIRRIIDAFFRGKRGAVYVELMIAFMPVFTFFLCLLQLALVFTARLFVEHTATTSARVAALTLGNPEAGENNMGAARPAMFTASRRALVRKSALLTLAPLILDGTVDNVDIDFPNTGFPAMGDQTAPMLRLKVTAQVECKIMIANHIFCRGGLNPTIKLQAESLFPVERAQYAPSTCM